MESLTLPARLRQSQGMNAASLRDLAIALNPSDERNIAQASFKAHKAETAAKVEEDCDLSTACYPEDTRTFAEYDAVRAIKADDNAYGNGHDEEIEQYRKSVSIHTIFTTNNANTSKIQSAPQLSAS